MSGIPHELIVRLRDPDRNVRVQAALDVGALNAPGAAGVLVEALAADPDFFVRETITWSIVRLGAAATPLLLDRLKDDSPSVRHDAVHALSKIGDPRALEALVAILGDESSKVVCKAAFALGQIGDTSAIPALVGLLGRDDRELESALNAVLERFGAGAVQPLVEALADANWRTREQAADALRGIGDPGAAPGLIPLLSDPCWQVRFAALNALGRLGAPPEIFEAVRNDDDRRVRALAVRLRTGRAVAPPATGSA